MTIATRKTRRLFLISSLLLGSIPGSIFGQSVLDKLKAAATQANQNTPKATPPPGQTAKPAAQPTAVPTAQMPASSAKVETLVLASNAPGLVFSVSPHGGHLAGVRQKGSRFVVIHDGVDGPVFDEILKDDKRGFVQFSPDGMRYLYVGRSGQEYVVMVDGKELMRLPVPTTHWYISSAGNYVDKVLPKFTPYGKHVIFEMHSDTPAPNGQDRLFFDGQPVASNWPVARSLVLSPDGDHYAYISSSNQVDVRGNENQWSLIVDGKPMSYQGSNPQFSADGKLLFTRTQLPNGQGVEILLNGKSYVRATDVKLYMPPAGYGVVLVVTRKGPSGNILSLAVDGKSVPGSDAQAIDNVYFSPDGKHYAVVCKLRAGVEFVIIDGKKGLEYQSIWSPDVATPPVFFSEDSMRSAYIGFSGGNQFAVIDGVESDGYTGISALGFGGQGKRAGFIGFGANNMRSIVVDGKATQRNGADLTLTFSPDGSRYAYTFSETHPVVDGVVEDGVILRPMTGRKINDNIKFVFSPDGKHVVHYGQYQADLTKQGFFIDGKFVADDGSLFPSNPTFTPDGRHLLWFATALKASGPPTDLVVYVDGRPAAKVDLDDDNKKLMTTVSGAWEMGSDGVLTFIANVGADIQRIRITPANDTSIDTMLSMARAK